ncbi:MAG: hypothetical protein ACLQDF_04620 [Desulfomonilia bacterium]
MADTSIQKIVETWVRDHVLAKKYGCQFSERHLSLSWGGKFKFDAVSEDSQIVANISSSPGKTNNGRSASGKIHKIKSDTLYLTNAIGPTMRIQVFTEQSMADHFTKEAQNGRYPGDVVLLTVELPVFIQAQVVKVRKVAVNEVTPST